MPSDPSQLLTGIPGVIRARVEWDGGRPSRVEVVADSRRPAGVVARDVRSALAATYGVDAGADGVRVLRVAGLDETREDVPHIASVTVCRTETGLEARVGVAFAGEVAHGVARGAFPDPRFEATVTAGATLQAMEVLLGERWFHLHGVSEAAVGDRRVVVVAVEARRADEATLGFGVAAVGDSVADAAARATLRALLSQVKG